eukprot:scaffold2979_cov243-Pinguiococcus_pyrenoidosus.AAC.11
MLADADHPDPPDVSTVRNLQQPLDGPNVSVLHGHPEDRLLRAVQARATDEGVHFQAVRWRGAHGLLYQHVLSGRDHCPQDFDVMHVRGADDDDVHAVVVDEILVVLVHLRLPHVRQRVQQGSGELQGLRMRVCHRREPKVHPIFAQELQNLVSCTVRINSNLDMLSAHLAHADDAVTQRHLALRRRRLRSLNDSAAIQIRNSRGVASHRRQERQQKPQQMDKFDNSPGHAESLRQ